LDDVKRQLSQLGFDEFTDTSEEEALEEISTDLSDQHRQNLLRDFVFAMRAFEGDMLAVVSRPSEQVRVRLKHDELRDLIDVGEDVIKRVATSDETVRLVGCFVRERGKRSSFLYGNLRHVDARFRKYLLRRHRVRFFLGIFLLLVGAALEIVLSFGNPDAALNAIGVRLGAPLFATGSIAFLEMFLSWRTARQMPIFGWSASRFTPQAQRIDGLLTNTD
jgi:hypothetical protein